MKHQHYSVSHEGHQVLPFSWETNNKSKRIELESQKRKAMPMSWPEIPRECQGTLTANTRQDILYPQYHGTEAVDTERCLV